MTNQEIFDNAYIGLASQGFQKCKSKTDEWGDSSCMYSDGKGNHCAWGWVDLSLGSEIADITVQCLSEMGIGIAATLDEEQLSFAQNLQNCHDISENPRDMKKLLIQFAKKYNLLIPNVVI